MTSSCSAPAVSPRLSVRDTSLARFGSSLVWRNDVNGTFPAVYNNTIAGNFSSGDLLLSQQDGATSLLMAGRFRITTDAAYHGVLRYTSSEIPPHCCRSICQLLGRKMAIRKAPEGEYLYVTDNYSATYQQPPMYMLQPGNTTWTPIPGVLMFQNREAIRDELCLCWFDDGGRDGGHLYIGGRFDTVNGLPAHGLAQSCKWCNETTCQLVWTEQIQLFMIWWSLMMDRGRRCMHLGLLDPSRVFRQTTSDPNGIWSASRRRGHRRDFARSLHASCISHGSRLRPKQ